MEKEKTEAMQQVIKFKMNFNCKRKKNINEILNGFK